MEKLDKIDSKQLSWFNIGSAALLFLYGLFSAIICADNGALLDKNGTGSLSSMVVTFVFSILLLVSCFVLIIFTEFLQIDFLVRKKERNGAFAYSIASALEILFLALSAKYTSYIGTWVVMFSASSSIDSFEDLIGFGYNALSYEHISIGIAITLCVIAGLTIILGCLIQFRWDVVKDALKTPDFNAIAKEVTSAVDNAKKPSTPEAETTPNFCQYCGTKLDPGTHFCPHCGSKVD